MALVVIALLILFCVIVCFRLRNTRNYADSMYLMLLTRDAQECRERNRRLVYERALGLPLTEPARTQEIWARASSGDELCEAILIEEMSVKTESPEAFTAET